MDDKQEQAIFEGTRSEKQRMFIIAYCNPESETFDNGAGSYDRVYECKNMNVAAVEAFKMLKKPHIQEAISRYKDYLHDQLGFELDWLDANLRNLFYRAKQNADEKTELSVLKTIGNRIGAFTDTKQENVGLNVEMTPEQEKMIPRIVSELMAADKRQEIKKVD